MLIIVEGSNKVGKSTIIGKLKKLHNVSTIYNRDIMKEMIDIKHDSLIASLAMLDVIKEASKHTNIILDRFHLSEYVYGKMKRGYCNPEMFTKIDAELAEMDCLLILVTSVYIHLQEHSWQDRAGEYLQLQDEFKRAYSTSRIKDKLMIRLEEVK